MTPGILHSLFERLFGSTDGASNGSGHARQVADLAAGLNHGNARHGELAENPERSAAFLAAYLDGGLDEAAQRDIHARLSGSAVAFHEAASADAFLDAITAERESAPADLVASTLARNHPAAVSPSSPRRSFPIWKWSGLIAGLATAAIVVLVIANRQPIPTDATAPITAKADQSPVTAADAPRFIAPQIPKENSSVAGKKTSPANMAPAASQETMPPPSSRRKMPKMAPESFDTVPGNQPPPR